MSNGGRVTTREFYDALLDQNKARADMELRILDRLDTITSSLATTDARFKATDDKIAVCYKTLSDDISENKKTIDKVRNLNAAIALLGSTIAGIIGVNK